MPAALAVDLAMLYGDRLRQVLLFGSWARDERPGEFDLQLIVVLTELRSPWEELRRMDDGAVAAQRALRAGHHRAAGDPAGVGRARARRRCGGPWPRPCASA